MFRKTFWIAFAIWIVASPSVGRPPPNPDPRLSAWIAVPEEKIVRRSDNPTGGAILCWSPDLGVMCFVPGPGV